MCPCTQKATSPRSQKLCHKTAKEATKALEYPELGPTRAVAEADESCAAGSDSSDETPLSEAEVDKWFADYIGSCAGSSAFHATLGA